jgi:serine/threonine-protein kinase
MGVVYLASDPMLNRQVAVKTVDLAVQEPEEREVLRNRLLRDARAAAVLKHPNIVAIYDVFEDAGRAYVVMEYIEGESLATRLRSNPFPDVSAMLKVLRQMADALDYTHARGVIHRDIKPANVMIDSSGGTKIMDFGIARITDTRTCTPTGMVVGTVEYMAPEQILGAELDGRADQFALAVVAYQMMTGSTLFGPHTLATLTYKIVNEAPPLPCTRNAALPRGVDAVLAKALSKKPADRFVTCTEFAEALARAFADAPTAPLAAPTVQATALRTQSTLAMPPSAALPVAAKPSRAPVIAAAIAVVLLAGALAAVILKPWNRPQEARTTPAAVVNPPATAPAEPLKSAAGATPSKKSPAAAPATTPPTGAAPAVSTPPPAKPAEPAQTQARAEPPKTEPKTVAPPAKTAPENSAGAVPAPLAAEPVAEDIVMAPPEPKMKSGPSPFQQAMQRGQQQVKAHDYANALRSFGDALALKPKSAPAHYSRGTVFEHFEQYDAAMRDFQDAIRLEPALIAAHTQLGACLSQLRRDNEALVEYQRALELNPNAVLALFGRGNIYYRRKQYAMALADYNKVLQLNPRFAPGYQNRAAARQAIGDLPGAAEDRRVEQSLRR